METIVGAVAAIILVGFVVSHTYNMAEKEKYTSIHIACLQGGGEWDGVQKICRRNR